MSGYIELQRALLEEIDVLENALAQRVRRNVDLIPAESRPDDVKDLYSTRKRPLKELVQQQHEASYFLEKCKKQKKEILDARNDHRVDQELDLIADPSALFSEIDAMFARITQHHEMNQKITSAPQTIDKIYEMYSSAPEDSITKTKKNKIKTKRRYVLSAAAAHLTAESLFSPEEAYGKYLDLREIHNEYRSLFDTTYRGFMAQLKERQLPTGSDHKTYTAFLQKLVAYLEDFYARKYPFRDIKAFMSEITQQSSINESNDDPLFCQACGKRFAKQTVFDAHLSGKKHKKNAEKNTTQSGNSASMLEFKACKLLEALSETLTNTISNLDRQAALTEREQQIEEFAAGGDDSEDTVVQSSSSDESSDSERDESAFANMPLGADGTPIPPWLYKLQGLHHSYDCEICGNISYKGRVAYNKHFGGAKHVQGLKLLGIDDGSIPTFKSISSIDEAVALWHRIKRTNRQEEGERENAVEVEDEAGNVMSKKDYLELKKQGLL